MANGARRAIPLTASLIAIGAAAAWTSSGLPGCSRDPLPAPVADPKGAPLALAEGVPFAALELPEGSRDGEAPPASVPLDGPWTTTGGRAGYQHAMPIPFRPRGLFFFSAQPGMSVRDATGRPIEFRRGGKGGRPFWNHDRDTLTVVTDDPAPPVGLSFAWPTATERESALNLAAATAAGLASGPDDFARGATVQEGWTSRQGLLLPAPARAAFDVTLPEAAVLTLAPGLVRPELASGPPSDGCRLTVAVDDGSGPVEVLARDLSPGQFEHRRVDLSRWSEKRVSLTFQTEPGPSARFDYCFVGEPIVASREANPQRAVIVFVDTLRPDHLSVYGYERDTTPQLEALAARAVVFENARSIAPWTLPSARTMVTGRHPEHYASTPTLPAILGARGFATGMIAGNVYLSANFDMNRDWDLHEVGKFDGRGWTSPPADEVTDQAIAWLDAHDGQDGLLLVHYMNAHLPYQEPLAHRVRYATASPPDGFPDPFTLQDVRRHSGDPAVRAWVEDRYDQTIRWVDGELARLFDRLDDNDVLIVLSDHGEEFWEHGGFEHGHTLYDELLRVPLIVKAPGLAPGRVSEPVSLLDVAPTILDGLGLPPAPVDGRSLLPLARGEPDARSAFAARPHAFGRPLYGGVEQWGVIDGAAKWTTSEGRESVFDLASDPGEQADLWRVGAGDPMRARFAEALGSPAPVGYRLAPAPGTAREPVTARVWIPGGIQHAWRGEDALQKTDLDMRRIDAETVEFTWRGGGRREAFVAPVRPVAEVTHALCVIATQRGLTDEWAVPGQVVPTPAGGRADLQKIRVPAGTLSLGWSFSPVPPEGGLELNATDSEMTEALEQIGYMTAEEPAPAAPAPGAAPERAGSPCAGRPVSP